MSMFSFFGFCANQGSTTRRTDDEVVIPDPDDGVTTSGVDRIVIPDPDDEVAIPDPDDGITASGLDRVVIPDPDDEVAIPDPDDEVVIPDPDDEVAIPDPDDEVAIPDPDDEVAIPDPDDGITTSGLDRVVIPDPDDKSLDKHQAIAVEAPGIELAESSAARENLNVTHERSEGLRDIPDTTLACAGSQTIKPSQPLANTAPADIPETTIPADSPTVKSSPDIPEATLADRPTVKPSQLVADQALADIPETTLADSPPDSLPVKPSQPLADGAATMKAVDSASSPMLESCMQTSSTSPALALGSPRPPISYLDTPSQLAMSPPGSPPIISLSYPDTAPSPPAMSPSPPDTPSQLVGTTLVQVSALLAQLQKLLAQDSALTGMEFTPKLAVSFQSAKDAVNVQIMVKV